MAVRIDVEQLGLREYAVEVLDEDDDPGAATQHRVVVPSGVLDRLLLDEDDGAALVRATFEFLLERTTADALPEEMSLVEVAEEHEDYDEEMRDRLS
ncbi:hypothetical protein [Vallicoccus soli]|uniref:Uncharacterized protein n=1 Tax=Vallicoccus soli TaxID=2339232 RepID=A0A3A3ZFA9_9ACTN|nr:hypothetical protein [Vallicoccus soli]RJK93807.1 hypothetical protein D5H78_15925 [Vallicoccus soli]